MELMTKGKKNETKALWVLSEPVRGLMYGRADALRGVEVGVVLGLAEVSKQTGHREEEKEQRERRGAGMRAM